MSRALSYSALAALTLGVLWWWSVRPTAAPPEPAVATVDGEAIPWSAVQRGFALRPAWRQGQSRLEAHRSQLELAVADRLLALAARAEGLDREEGTAAHLSFLEDKEVIRGLYRKDVLDGVAPDDRALAEAYARAKRRVRLQFARTTDVGRAQGYAAQLRAEALRVREPDHGGTSDWIAFGDVPEALEAVVFQLEPGAVAGPIAVGDEYYVVRLLEGERERFQSEQDFAEQRSKLRRVLTERRARPVAAQYVADVMAEQRVRLDRAGFVALGRALERVLPRLTSEAPLPARLAAEAAEALPLTGRETVVTYAGGSLTAGEVLGALSYHPTSLIRPDRALAPQLRDAIAVIVRNRVLAARGRAMGLDSQPEVVAETRQAQERLLADRYRARYRDSLAVTPGEIAAFRASDTFDEAERHAGGVLTDQELSAVIADYRAAAWEVRTVERLRKRFAVHMDEHALRARVARPDERLDYAPTPIAIRELFD